MPVVQPKPHEFNLYLNLMLFLNNHNGWVRLDDGDYYDFLDQNKVTHKQVNHAVTRCVPYNNNVYKFCNYHVVYRNKKETGYSDGAYYLTSDGYDLIYYKPRNFFPDYMPEPEPDLPKREPEPEPEKNTEPKQFNTGSALIDSILMEMEQKKRAQNHEWTKPELIQLLTTEAHVVARMLGTGYDLFEEIHGEWIQEWLLNPTRRKVTIHQAHRNSYKSAALRLMVAIYLILYPLNTVIIIRKSEDAIKELVSGVSKILDTPLFHTFVNILYPDIIHKGGFKKVTDTAMIVDTNLNTGLSGEPQLRGIGLGSQLTGKHATLIVTDDIVNIDDRISQSERDFTKSRYQELMNVLSTDKKFTDSRILNIGTPWHEEDAFSLMEKALPEKSSYQKELEEIPLKDRTNDIKCQIQALNIQRGLFVYDCYQTGLMSEEDIQWKKQTLNDDTLFAANYLLTLVSDNEKPFPRIKNVGNYSISFFKNDCYEAFGHIDCSYGGEDSTAASVGGSDYNTNTVVVLGKKYKRGISIDQNYLEIANLFFECGVNTIFLETNADKGLIGQKFRELGFNVVGYHEHTNKHVKIISTIRPYWREDGNEIMPCVQFVGETDKEYLSEIYDYKEGVRHDDCPDNLSRLLLMGKFGVSPIRITFC